MPAERAGAGSWTPGAAGATTQHGGAQLPYTDGPAEASGPNSVVDEADYDYEDGDDEEDEDDLAAGCGAAPPATAPDVPGAAEVGHDPTEAEAEAEPPGGRAALTEREWALAHGLGQGYTHAQVAKLHGISTKTIQRALANPAFAAEVKRARRYHFAEVTGALGREALGAVRTLHRVESNEERPADQVRAAHVLLNHYGHYFHQAEELDLADRVDAIEAALMTLQDEQAGTPKRGRRS